MTIYENEPKTWKDLQNKVAEILTVCGYLCETEKDIITVREKVNVDVYAEINNQVSGSVIICECKFWKKKVPKHVVHSFRTVINDYGANYGLIISKMGFQSGAFNAIKNTNVQLVNWTEFENTFRAEWIRKKLIAISKTTKSLYDYVGVGFMVFFKEQLSKLPQDELEKYHYLTEKYFNPVFASANIDYKNEETKEFDIEMFDNFLPHYMRELNINFCTSYENYFLHLEKICTEGLVEFDKLFEEELRR
ncbi:restriction endonuclease [Flavobacterium sp. N2469]|nr:restriction endonuclease [Flavobacterium sp. N2469]